jgi:predicted small secreted protein
MKAFGGFMKGVGAGIAVGMVAATFASNMKRGKKTIRKNALRAVKSVGDFVSNVQYMMK